MDTSLQITKLAVDNLCAKSIQSFPRKKYERKKLVVYRRGISRTSKHCKKEKLAKSKIIQAVG